MVGIGGADLLTYERYGYARSRFQPRVACFNGGLGRKHVLRPKGFSGALDWPRALIAIAAAIALFLDSSVGYFRY